jgi:hypothetical protein
MPHVVVIIVAVLAMLFNAVGVPGPREPTGTSSGLAPDLVMMVLDQVEHRA